jgi:hypothetical protein
MDHNTYHWRHCFLHGFLPWLNQALFSTAMPITFVIVRLSFCEGFHLSPNISSNPSTTFVPICTASTAAPPTRSRAATAMHRQVSWIR